MSHSYDDNDYRRHDHHHGLVGSILDFIESKEIKESLAELLFEDLHDMRFEDALTQVKIRKLQRDISDMDRMIEKDPQLLKQKRTLTQKYRRMTKKVVNKVLFQSGHI
jgi:predicted phage tail protein